MYEINFKETRKIILEKNNDNENQDKKRKENQKFGTLCKIHQHVLNRNFNF